MKKIYQSYWNKKINLPLFFGLMLLLISGLLRYDPNQINLQDLLARYVILAPVLPLIIFLALKLTFIKIKEDRITMVNFLIDRSSAYIKDINRLNMGKMLGYIPVIEFRAKNEKLLMQISLSVFDRRILKDLISDLKKVKPDVSLDSEISNLLK